MGHQDNFAWLRDDDGDILVVHMPRRPYVGVTGSNPRDLRNGDWHHIVIERVFERLAKVIDEVLQ